MSGRDALEADLQEERFKPIQSMQRVRREHGRSILAQCLDMAKLGMAEGRLTPKDYYFFRLFDLDRFSEADRRRFLGHNAQIAINRFCNDPHWRAIGEDKLIFTTAMQGLGFPVPKIFAIYHPSRSFGQAASLRSSEALSRFLRNGIGYPFFSKPINAMFSKGVARVDGIDPKHDTLTLAFDRKLALADYVAAATSYPDGYLIQELLRPHEEVRRICGDRIASLRLMVVLEPAGPKIIRATWKIPGGANIADNIWRKGNVFAPIDVDSGRVGQACQGSGLGQVDVDRHPDTGTQIKGVTLPNWSATKDLCLAAAASLPGVRIQGWDLALCQDGPVLQEVNIGGGYRIPQLAARSGLLDDSFRNFLNDQFPGWQSAVVRGIAKRFPLAVRHLLK